MFPLLTFPVPDCTQSFSPTPFPTFLILRMMVAKSSHLMSPQMPHHLSLFHIHLLAPISDRALRNSRLFDNRIEWCIEVPLPRSPSQLAVRRFRNHVRWSRGPLLLSGWVFGDGAAGGGTTKTNVAGGYGGCGDCRVCGFCGSWLGCGWGRAAATGGIHLEAVDGPICGFKGGGIILYVILACGCLGGASAVLGPNTSYNKSEQSSITTRA